MKINCIVVDDEPIARDLLKSYIADVPSLHLAQSCGNAFEATEALMKHEVHLIFLDINMPRLSGMSFYKSLSNPPYVIFTTAYSEYALEGFEVNATDFLLKPFSFERFYNAVSRVITQQKPLIKYDDRDFILLKADKKMHRIHLSDIFFLEGLGDYVKVHLVDSFLVVHDRLKNILALLPSSFQRIHKSYVVSIQKVKFIDGNMVNIGEHELSIGQTYKEEFLNALSGLQNGRGKGE